MTVAVETSRIVHTGNGATTNWPFPFPVLAADDLAVYTYEISTGILTGPLNPSLYTVNEVGEDDGSVDYPLVGSPLAATHKIILDRTVDMLQPYNFNTASGFDPAALTAQLDLMTMMIQQNADDVSRAIKVDISGTTDPDDVDIEALIAAAEIAEDVVAALPALVANTMLITNAGGTARENKTFAEVRTALSVLPFIDEDNMASNSASHVPTQQSVKAYADTKVAIGAAILDVSSVVGSPATMWNPTYFGNPGTGVVHRMNRLLVGEAVLSSSDRPQSVPSWLETLQETAVSNAQLAAVSTVGGLGIVGAARTSDYRTWAGAASGGSQGVTGFGWNDDLGAGTPIAVGSEFRGFRKSGVNGITCGSQISAANEGSTVDITPFGGVVSGSTIALLLTNGPGPTGYDNPISAGLVFGSGTGVELMRKGVAFLNGALDTTVGVGGGGVAIDFYRGQSMRWLDSASAVDAEIWASSTGLNFNRTGAKQVEIIGSNLSVNFLSLRGNTAGGFFGPVVQADGADTNINLSFVAKGTGSFFFNNGGGISMQIDGVASAANRIGISSAIAAATPIIYVEGSDTNVSGALRGKGTGGWSFLDGGSVKKFEYNTTGIGFFGTTPVAAKTGWGVPTGTLTRTTFVTSTVTLPQLAERVAALIADNHQTAGYGLLRT